MSSETNLKNSILLCHLESAQLNEIRAISVTRKYNKDEQIIRDREDDDCVHFINQGIVRVTLFSQDGKEVSFIDLKVGENFGELSAIDGAPRTANVIALTNSSITSIPRSTFKRLVYNNLSVSEALMQQLVTMIRRLSERIFAYSTLDAKNRIHAELLRLAHENGKENGIFNIANPPTHTQFASRISSHREAVSREMSYLEKERIICKENGQLIVLDIAQLEHLVNTALRH